MPVLKDKSVENLLLVRGRELRRGRRTRIQGRRRRKKLKYDYKMSIQDNQHLKNENF
jgi:hypothetical protein